LVAALVESENEKLVTKSYFSEELGAAKTELKNDIKSEIKEVKTESKDQFIKLAWMIGILFSAVIFVMGAQLALYQFLITHLGK